MSFSPKAQEITVYFICMKLKIFSDYVILIFPRKQHYCYPGPMSHLIKRPH